MYPRECIPIFRTHLQVDMYGEGVTLPGTEAFTGYIQVQVDIHLCSTTGKPTHLFRTKCASLDSV
jgi:hypothetical protein